MLKPGSGLRFIWTNPTSVSLHYSDHLVSYSIVHSLAAKMAEWKQHPSSIQAVSSGHTYTYINILHSIFIYMYDHMLCFYKAEYIFPLAMSWQHCFLSSRTVLPWQSPFLQSSLSCPDTMTGTKTKTQIKFTLKWVRLKMYYLSLHFSHIQL